MAITRPFAYNTGSAIAGTAQHGSVAVGTTIRDYSNYGNVEWFMGPDETRGYIVPHPVPGRPKNMGLLGANGFSESNFLNAVNKGLGTAYTAGYTAYNNLSGSYYTNYRPIVSDGLILDLDASNLYSYPGSGTTWSSTTGSLSGSLTNGPAFSTGGSGSIMFDGVDDAVFFPGGTFGYNPGTTGELSLEMWIYPTGPFSSYTAEPPTTNLGGFFGQSYFNSSIGWGLGMSAANGNNYWAFQVRNRAVISDQGRGLNLIFTTGSWYHVVGSFTRNDFSRVYVNGQLAASTSSINLNGLTLNPSRTDAALGQIRDSFYSGCKIQVARLYNRPLSSTEVLQNYTAQATRFGHTPVVTDSLLLYYDISNKASYPATGSIVTNLWTENITGSLVNGTSYTASNGGALVFDGVDDHVLVADESKFNFAGGTFSIDAWFKPTVWSGTWTAVFTKGDSAWRMHRYATGAIAFGTRGLVPIDTYSSTILTAGNWYNVTCVFDGAFKKIYINGVLDSNVRTTGTFQDLGNYPVMLGENAQARGRYFNGEIGNAKVYNRALYADEVLQNFSASKDQYGL